MMNSALKAAAVLYAKDMNKMAAFYSAVLGLTTEARDDEHALLTSSAVELVVRQIPSVIAERVEITVPPARRADSVVKLVFFVPDMDNVRAAVAAYGGVMDGQAKDWLFNGWQLWDGVDPEGNVIQFRARPDTAAVAGKALLREVVNEP